MKTFSALAVLGVLSVAEALSPVTRVVELLNGLTKQVEAENKAEEDLYETFVCWAKSMISQKTKTNAAAEARSTELTTYISDLVNGRIELTTERTDLTKEVEELSSDIEVATQMREKDNNDFEGAKDEMTKAIAALTKAIEVLGAATKDHKDGVLLAMQSRLDSGFEARAKEASSLAYAADLGERVLMKGDATFLRRLLTGEVPKPDWKKLNRKATFKMDYKARSFKIQDVLAKLLETFSSDLASAEQKEADAVTLFGKLMDSKGAEKDAAQQALSKMEKENGARGLSKEESQDELDAFTTQISNDKKYISQVEKSLADKKVEWKERQVLRAGELAAISKAVGILHSDDSRDLFKRSFASQDKGSSFLQTASSTSSAHRSARAVEVLRAAGAGRDARLAVLAVRAEGGHFEEVVQAIDKMLSSLQSEEDADLAKKEMCESDRAADTRQAIKTSREMDELSDQITADLSTIEQLTAEIAEKTQQRADIKKELGEMTQIRADEHKEWQATNKDDRAAKELVLNAKDVIANFYSENGLALVQKGKAPFNSVAGEAPPPPPPTWEAPYGGKTDEQMGVVAVLEMIAEDIQTDSNKAKAEEDAAEALFLKSKEAMETEMDALQTSINQLTKTRSGKEGDVGDNTADRLGKHGELGVVMKRIKDAEPGCDYFTINYPLRVKNRQIEVDGLNKAKTILSGGSFTAPEDPNREMRPGDALVQRRSKFLGRAAVL